MGCTRIELKASGCKRDSEISSKYNIVIENTDQSKVTETIKSCIEDIGSAKVIYTDASNNFMHATIQSFLFGFLDDFYVQTAENAPGQLQVDFAIV